MSVVSYLRKIPTLTRYLTVLHNKQLYNLENLNVPLLKQRNSFSLVSTIVGNNRNKNVDIFATLDLNLRDQQRIRKNDLMTALNQLEHKEIDRGEYAQFLIECCGHSIPDTLPKERIILANQIWRTYTSKKVKLDINFYNAFIRCFIENEMGISYKEFLKTMSCEPNEETYQLLLKCVCEKGDLNQATDIINMMKTAGYPANEPVFSSLIIGHLRSQDVSNAKNILSTMKLALLTPTELTYTELLRGFAELNDEINFNNYLNEASKANINNKNIISILRSICQSENLNFLSKVKNSFADVIISRTFQTNLTNLCVNLIHLNKPKVAYETYKSFVDPDIGFLSESDTYASSLIYEMVKFKTESSKIIDILQDLVTTKRNEYALFKALYFALQDSNVNLAIFLLQTLHSKNIKLRNHYFWPILINASKASQTEMLKIFQLMVNLGVKIDHETLEIYSLQYIKNIEPNIVIQQLKELDLKVTDILTPLSIVLLRANRCRDVVEICKKYRIKLNGDLITKPMSLLFLKKYDVKNTIDLLKCIKDEKYVGKYNGQLLIYLFNKPNIDFNQILKLLEGLQQNKMKISSYSLDKIEYFSRKIENPTTKLKILQISNSIVDFNNHENNTTNIPHPRDMNLEQLECHLIELNNKKMETRGILRKLVQIHCRLGNENRVGELLEEFNKAKYRLSTGMMAGLMDLYIKTENLKMTKTYYDEILKSDPTFIIDEFKVIDLANLLVKELKFDEALNLIKTESQKRTIRGGKTIEQNCWRLLNSIASTGDGNQMKLFFETLTNIGFCIPSNIMLGPLVRVHLKNDNLTDAVKEYVGCCEKYKCTPLQQELILKLVNTKNDTALIEQIIESTGKIHGLQSAKMAFIAALATTNKINTLQQFLTELNGDIPLNLMEQHCNRWIAENNTLPLENLFQMNNYISQTNINIITQTLMRIYFTQNDWGKGLKLWNKLQELDYPTSETLRSQIVALLTNNKHPMATRL